MKKCEICNTIKTECNYCDNEVCIRCNLHLKLRGVVYCFSCSEQCCNKCKRMTHKCMRCRITHCTDCDDGCFISNSWDPDVYYCKRCRPINIEELYKYVVEKYNEKLTLKEIKDLIKSRNKHGV